MLARLRLFVPTRSRLRFLVQVLTLFLTVWGSVVVGHYAAEKISTALPALSCAYDKEHGSYCVLIPLQHQMHHRIGEALVKAQQVKNAVIVPVGAADHYGAGDLHQGAPVVLLGRSVDDGSIDTVTIDNVSAGSQATNYLLDLGHTRIGSVTGPLHISTGRGRYDGMVEAMRARGLAPDPAHVRSGDFREDVAYSVARDLLARPDRPTALYVANGVMALGVMRAVIDLGLRCPDDISSASTDNIAGLGGLKPQLTRTEHPVLDMTNEALRMLAERLKGKGPPSGRSIVFRPALVVGDSCAPLRPRAARQRK